MKYVLFTDISETAEWQKRYCIIDRNERKLYFFLDQEVRHYVCVCVCVCVIRERERDLLLSIDQQIQRGR